MRIAAVCGSGLGTSFMVEMNIQKILKDLGVTDVEVNHYDLGTASPDVADVFVVASDLASNTTHLGKVVVLDSIIDMDELTEKITKLCQEEGLI